MSAPRFCARPGGAMFVTESRARGFERLILSFMKSARSMQHQHRRLLLSSSSSSSSLSSSSGRIFSSPLLLNVPPVWARQDILQANLHLPIIRGLSTAPGFQGYKNNNGDDELVVAILGPPNAGKSTLFNRLACKERNKTYRLASDKSSSKSRGRGRIRAQNRDMAGSAIVSDVPGTTRDRRECFGRIGGTTFRLVDTAGVDGMRIGLLRKKQKSLAEQERHEDGYTHVDVEMIKQTLEAAKKADVVLLMFDARVGISQDLKETANWLRMLGKAGPEVILLANKLEGDKWSYPGSNILEHLEDVSRIGFGDPVPISAVHGEGMADIAVYLDHLAAKKAEKSIPEEHSEAQVDSKHIESDAGEKEQPLQLAILGRPNVGKSTLVNRILQEERVISGPMPGLTRDAICIPWSWKGRPVQLVDTAGIRKLTKRLGNENAVEDMAVADALRAMKVADVAVLVLDAQELVLHRQELAIASAVVAEGRALVVAGNKMDLLEMDGDEYTSNTFAKAVHDQLEARIPMLRQTPVVPMVAETGEGVEDLLPVVFTARDRWERTIQTGLLNRWLKEVLIGSSPPKVNGVTVKIKYIIQTKGRPPTFLLFCNVPDIPDTYLRYLMRHFQDTFEMYGMQIRMSVKQSAKANPYDIESTRKRGGAGVGGREARMKRLYKQLQATGKPKPETRRKRKWKRR